MANINNNTSDTIITGTADYDYIGNTGSSVTIDAGDGDDDIHNSGNNVSIDAGADNDSITNSGSDVTIYANSGNDSIGNYGSSVTIDAGAGDNFIVNVAYGTLNASSVIILANDGADTIRNYGDSVTIDSGAGNDSIVNSGNDMTIDGGAGNDTIAFGENSSQLLVYSEGDGDDTVSVESDAQYTLQVDSSATPTTVNSGDDLVVQVGDGSITFLGQANHTLNIVDPSGTTIDLTGEENPTGVTLANATPDTLFEGSDYTDSLRNDSTATNVTVQSYGENDTVLNYAESVTVDSGDGDDRIYNDGANVTITSGGGSDTVSIGANATLVTLIDFDTAADVLVFESAIAKNSLRESTNADDELVLSSPAITLTLKNATALTDEILNYSVRNGTGTNTIRELMYTPASVSSVLVNLNDASGATGSFYIPAYNTSSIPTAEFGTDTTTSGEIAGAVPTAKVYGAEEKYPQSIEVAEGWNVTATGLNDTINVTGDSATVQSGAGNDSIFNAGDNSTLIGGTGDDTIANGYNLDGTNLDGGDNSYIDGGAGNDTVLNDGNSATIESGNGNDYIYNDSHGHSVTIDSGAGNDTLINYGNIVVISTGEGTDSVDNTGDIVTINSGLGNDTVINYGDSVSIDTGAGDDSIHNNRYNVTINTGTGNDSITFGASSTNLLVYSEGDGNDTVSVASGAQYTLQVDSSATLTTVNSGDDLVVKVGDGSITFLGQANGALNIVDTSGGAIDLSGGSTDSDTTPGGSGGLLKGAIDIVFIIDNTGSMSSYINKVKRDVSSFADSLREEKVKFRLGLVEYGDIAESEGQVTKYDFTNNVDTFISQVNAISTRGGGDGPESGLEALVDSENGALSMDFRDNVSKRFIVLTDDSFHNQGESGDGNPVAYLVTDDVLGELLIENVVLDVVGKTKTQCQYEWEPLANATGVEPENGKFYDISLSNYSDIFIEIAKDIVAQTTDVFAVDLSTVPESQAGVFIVNSSVDADGNTVFDSLAAFKNEADSDDVVIGTVTADKFYTADSDSDAYRQAVTIPASWNVTGTDKSDTLKITGNNATVAGAGGIDIFSVGSGVSNVTFADLAPSDDRISFADAIPEKSLRERDRNGRLTLYSRDITLTFQNLSTDGDESILSDFHNFRISNGGTSTPIENLLFDGVNYVTVDLNSMQSGESGYVIISADNTDKIPSASLVASYDDAIYEQIGLVKPGKVYVADDHDYAYEQQIFVPEGWDATGTENDDTINVTGDRTTISGNKGSDQISIGSGVKHIIITDLDLGATVETSPETLEPATETEETPILLMSMAVAPADETFEPEFLLASAAVETEPTFLLAAEDSNSETIQPDKDALIFADKIDKDSLVWTFDPEAVTLASDDLEIVMYGVTELSDDILNYEITTGGVTNKIQELLKVTVDEVTVNLDAAADSTGSFYISEYNLSSSPTADFGGSTGADDTVIGTVAQEKIYAAASNSVKQTINVAENWNASATDKNDRLNVLGSATVASGEGSDTISVAGGTVNLTFADFDTSDQLIFEDLIAKGSMLQKVDGDSVVIYSDEISIAWQGVTELTSEILDYSFNNGSTRATIEELLVPDTIVAVDLESVPESETGEFVIVDYANNTLQNAEFFADDGSAWYNGHRYKVFSDVNTTWEEAKAYAESLGGHLVTITDAEEQAAVETLLQAETAPKNSYWLGDECEGAAVWQWNYGGGSGQDTENIGLIVEWDTGEENVGTVTEDKVYEAETDSDAFRQAITVDENWLAAATDGDDSINVTGDNATVVSGGGRDTISIGRGVKTVTFADIDTAADKIIFTDKIAENSLLQTAGENEVTLASDDISLVWQGTGTLTDNILNYTVNNGGDTNTLLDLLEVQVEQVTVKLGEVSENETGYFVVANGNKNSLPTAEFELAKEIRGTVVGSVTTENFYVADTLSSAFRQNLDVTENWYANATDKSDFINVNGDAATIASGLGNDTISVAGGVSSITLTDFDTAADILIFTDKIATESLKQETGEDSVKLFSDDFSITFSGVDELTEELLGYTFNNGGTQNTLSELLAPEESPGIDDLPNIDEVIVNPDASMRMSLSHWSYGFTPPATSETTT